MIEQPEVLKDDADSPSETGDRSFVEGEGVAAKQRDRAARRPQGQKNEPQKRRLAGARGASQKLKRLRPDVKADILRISAPIP